MRMHSQSVGHSFVTQKCQNGSVVEIKLTIGASYARLAGVWHNIINNNDSAYSVIEIELK